MSRRLASGSVVGRAHDHENRRRRIARELVRDRQLCLDAGITQIDGKSIANMKGVADIAIMRGALGLPPSSLSEQTMVVPLVHKDDYDVMELEELRAVAWQKHHIRTSQYISAPALRRKLRLQDSEQALREAG